MLFVFEVSKCFMSKLDSGLIFQTCYCFPGLQRCPSKKSYQLWFPRELTEAQLASSSLGDTGHPGREWAWGLDNQLC